MQKVDEHIYTIPNFLSTSECKQFIELSENTGYENATVKTEKGLKVIGSVRNNLRVFYSDPELAVRLWDRIKDFVPKRIGNSEAIGLNELFRFYKYEAGHRFKKHIDESFIRNENEASFFTFMIYLNSEYTDGQTIFRNIVVSGKTGMALLFLHSLEHEGAEVTKGTKYILRTDVMYRLAE